jgi:hypothetical protein
MAKKTPYAIKLEKTLNEKINTIHRLETEKHYLMIALNITQYESSIESLIRECSKITYEHQKTQKEYDRINTHRMKLLEEMNKIRFENMKLSLENRRLAFENIELNLKSDGFGERKSLTTIPKDMMRRLIQLVHPDKHNGSEAANTATQWLLSQR